MSKEIPIWEKFLLSVKEASMYFNIGENKLYRILDDLTNSGIVIQNGSKSMINRRKFENFLDNLSSI